jgi:hypothetical protein
METQIGAINWDTVELDHLAKYYDSFWRSLRIIRAILGSITWFVILILVELGLAVYFVTLEPPTNAWGETTGAWRFFLSWEYSAVMTIYSLLIVSIWYIFFYLFRNVSAGSIRSARLMVALMSPVLLLNILSVGFWAFLLGYLSFFYTPRAIGTQSPSSFTFSIIVPVISWNLLGVYTAYLLLTGLVRRITGRKQPFYRLFHNEKYSREFWPGWAKLLYNFWLIMDISPPRKVRRATRVTRVTIAALCGFMLEGFTTTAYMWPLAPLVLAHESHHGEYERYQEEMSLSRELVVGIIVTPFLMASGWVIFAVSRILRGYARRHSLISAAAAMLADPRKPVLFLRSFSDDQISLSKAKIPWLQRFVDPGAVVGTLEELLVSEYADVGPVIAIGKPSDDPDDLPPLGAARQYCQGTEWQEMVRSLMQASALIVVGVGQSAGLAWEITTIRAGNLLTKTVFVFPPDFAKDRSMLQDLCTKLDLSEMPQFRSDQAVISVSFLAVGRPQLLLSSRVTETVYQIAIRAAKEPDVIPRARNLDLDTHSPAMPPIRATTG